MAPSAPSFRNDFLRQFQLYLVQGGVLSVFALMYVMLTERGAHPVWPLLAVGMVLALLVRYSLETPLEHGSAAPAYNSDSVSIAKPELVWCREVSHPSLQDSDLLRNTLRYASPWTLSTTKRAFDITVASFGLLFGAPLLASIAIAIRIDSRGPAIFRQKRLGAGGSTFVAYKFRTMQVRPTRGLRLATSTDPRITRIGGLLRKFKLDELPQLLNVIRGDMALVGPRAKVAVDEPMHLMYRPGIASPSALIFRHEEELLSQVPLKGIEKILPFVFAAGQGAPRF